MDLAPVSKLVEDHGASSMPTASTNHSNEPEDTRRLVDMNRFSWFSSIYVDGLFLFGEIFFLIDVDCNAMWWISTRRIQELLQP